MTTASISFPTMEAPGPDDTMEMGSPYLGQADDFDIDLDAMEDQASNADKDMTVDDAFPEASHESGYNQDVSNDADMADDVSESAMVDADDKYPEENYGIEMQYGEEETYEAEMLEDDYDEDIDAPVPDTEDQVSVTLEDANNEEIEQKKPDPAEPIDTNHAVEENQEKPAAEPLSEAGVEHFSQQNEESHFDTEQHSGKDTDGVVEGIDPDQGQAQQEEVVDGTNNAEPVNPEESRVEGDENERPNEQPEVREQHNADDHPGNETHQTTFQSDEICPPDEKDTAESNEQPTDTSQHTVPLHPVKIYYQDNEISLFPPREGDSSETFFLEDENIAYNGFDKLFMSCREVLQEHIGENEILVIDVDILNIQFSEDSLHMSKLTLHQIIDLYLRLCHNDGIKEPEAMYLSLSTKLTVPAEVSSLFAAADEGKGLSEIHPWDEYDEIEVSAEAEPTSAEAHEDADYQEHHESQTQGTEDQDAVEQHDSEGISAEDKPNIGEQKVHDEPQKNQQTEHDEKSADDHDEAADPDTDHYRTESEKYPDVAQNPGAEEDDGRDVSAADDENEEYINVGQIPEAEEGHDEGVPFAENDLEEGEYENENEAEQEAEVENETTDHRTPQEESYDSEAQKTESTATIGHLPAANLEEDQHDGDQSTNVSHNGQASHETHETQDDYDEYYTVEDTGDYHEEEDHVDDLVHDDDPETFEEHGATDIYAEANGDAEQLQDPMQPQGSNEHDHGDEKNSAPEESKYPAANSQQNDNEIIPAERQEYRLDENHADMSGNENRATPEPADDLLGITEDLMESPSKAPKGKDEEVQNQPGSGEQHGGPEHGPATDVAEDDSEDLIFDNEDYIDLGYAETIDGGEVEPPAPDSKVTDSIPTKRSREPEDEFELADSPSPDAKRTRSS